MPSLRFRTCCDMPVASPQGTTKASDFRYEALADRVFDRRVWLLSLLLLGPRYNAQPQTIGFRSAVHSDHGTTHSTDCSDAFFLQDSNQFGGRKLFACVLFAGIFYGLSLPQ